MDSRGDSGTDAAATCGVGTADPGKVSCGAATCTTPAEVCCYEPAGPVCKTKSACNAPSIACDESTDCAATGSYCCSGASVLLPDAAVSIFVGTECTTDPKQCLPQPGIGNSSAEACKVDSECAGTGSRCIAHDCSGVHQCVRLCSSSAGVTGCN